MASNLLVFLCKGSYILRVIKFFLLYNTVTLVLLMQDIINGSLFINKINSIFGKISLFKLSEIIIIILSIFSALIVNRYSEENGGMQE